MRIETITKLGLAHGLIFRIAIVCCLFVSAGEALLCDDTGFDIQKFEELVKDKTNAEKYQIIIDSLTTAPGVYLDNKLALSKYYLKLGMAEGDSEKIANGYYKVATWCRLKGDYSYSLEYFHKALEYFLAHGISTEIVRTYINIGMVYINTDKIDSSYAYYMRALELSEASGNLFDIGISCHNLANVLCLKAEYHEALGYARKALNSYRLIVPESDTTKEFGFPITYRYMGNIFQGMNMPDSAIHYYKKSIRMGEYIQSMILITEPSIDLGGLYNGLKQYKTALEYLLPAYGIVKEQKRYRLKALCLRHISEAYEGLGNTAKSLEFYKLYKTECDTLAKYDIRAMEAMLDLQNEKESSARKDMLSARKDERNTYILVSSGALLLALSVLLFVLSSKYKLKKRHNADLEEMNHTKTRLFSIISHDLKSPMEALHQAIASKVADRYILTGSLRIKSLVENLLNWARLQMGGLKLFYAEINLNQLATENVQLCSDLSANKRITIANDIESDINVFADRQALGLAFRNLLHNAIKFSYPGGRIEIFSEKSDTAISIYFKDYGLGFEPATKESLFNLNTTIVRSGTKSEIGSGLGLIIVKSIIEKHYGEIAVADNPAGGSIIKITIPNE